MLTFGSFSSLLLLVGSTWVRTGRAVRVDFVTPVFETVWLTVVVVVVVVVFLVEVFDLAESLVLAKVADGDGFPSTPVGSEDRFERVMCGADVVIAIGTVCCCRLGGREDNNGVDGCFVWK